MCQKARFTDLPMELFAANDDGPGLARARMVIWIVSVAAIAGVAIALWWVTGARAQSADALTVLTTVGYYTGAADTCGVARQESNALSGGMAIAISKGQYGDAARAHTLLNNARQEGSSAASRKKVDCTRVADFIRNYTGSLLHK